MPPRRTVLCLAFALFTTGSRASLSLDDGDCRVVSPTSQPFDCVGAAFGSFLPSDDAAHTKALPLRIAPGDMLACQTLDTDSLRDTVVLARRGSCTFQQKLANIAAAGGVGMVLINTDDSFLPLGTLEYAPIDAFAVAVKRTEGDKLASLVKNASFESQVAVAIRSTHGTLDQAWQRIQHLMQINAPQVAYETFFQALPTEVRDLDRLLHFIVDRSPTVVSGEHLSTLEETVTFLQKCSDAFHDQWDFTRDASFHAAVAAAALINHNHTDHIPSLRSKILTVGAVKLLGGGYYDHAAKLLENVQDNPVSRCFKRFISFIQGDVLTAVRGGQDCVDQRSQFNVTSTGLQVAHDNFLRLLSMDIDQGLDLSCAVALDLEGVAFPGISARPTCCRPRSDSRSEHTMEKEGSHHDKATKRRSFWYQSPFIEELHHTLNIMGVFMDETGAFDQSLAFFRQASRLCDDWSLATEFRRALAIPIVFDSTESMELYFTQVRHQIDDLRALRQKKELLLSSLTGSDSYAHFFARPEDAMYLSYTVTPPTMFIGYQGYDVLAMQRDVFALRTELFPSLTSRYQPLNTLFLHPDRAQRRRIAFVSTWFRNHSVGKLILGVIKRLDRTKFHIMVYRSVHFLRASDELTKQFHREADSYMELPVDQENAVALLRHEAIDVLIYPELGMDAWTQFLSHHRVAPVQCVFWGHPITTANPAIDYFITSEYFIADFFEVDPIGDRTADDDATLDSWPGTYHGSSFSEQVVLFRGLSTFFTNKYPTGHPPVAFERAMLHLPATSRLYVCPQTLMKLHPAFDAVLEGILTRDPQSRIVLLSSPSQRVWKEQLRRRFRRRFGESHRRVVFFSTLPYEEFMGLLAAADVVLDPFPFGGGVTTLDALAVGTPVVTLPSAQTVPQLAAGFLRYMGIHDTIVTSVDEFVSLSLAIAHDATRREQLRDRILAHHAELYEDETTLDDWNAFLEGVHVDAQA